MAIHLRNALLTDGWSRDVRITMSRDGRIDAVDPATAPRAGDTCRVIGIPGIANVHSHAFQHAMRGLSEQVPQGAPDSFWGWREALYGFAGRLDPDTMTALATQAYRQMLEAGFTHVAEFHYLHHAPDGRPYADVAEMARAVLEAAQRTGIGITLLPVHYACSDFGGVPPLPGQRRFVTDPDSYLSLHERVQALVRELPTALAGTALHSLRAVTPRGMETVLARAVDGPVHIHVAEQEREVQACLAWCGARPVQWLLDNASVDMRWCLVHATHVDDSELAALARSAAVVGLCPVTEANLGDGIFPAARFAALKGRYAVGSDSNMCIGAAEELRMLEYGQRLTALRRNCMGAASGCHSPGRALVEQSASAGALACGVDAGRLAPGARADLVALDADHEALAGNQDDGWLDAWIFSAGGTAVSDVWVAGRHVVSDGICRGVK
jgi:formiminoglutamate deiminase